MKSWHVSQEAAAERLGITRPRLNDLMRGKLGKFSLDALVNLVTAAGLVLKIQIEDAADPNIATSDILFLTALSQ